jgi:hypothetical protein
MRLSLALVLVGWLAACGRPLVGASDGGTTSETSSAGESTGSETSSSVDGSDGFEDQDCGGFSIVPTYVYPHVMLVVDVSSSMHQSWDHDQDAMTPAVPRWVTARALLDQVIPALDGNIWFGLQRAPSVDACPAATVDEPNCTDADVCLVGATPEIEIGELHGEPILASLPDVSASPLELVGGSPIGAAYVTALDHLLAQPDRTVSAIVLVTDGGANCSEPSLPEAVEVFDDELEALVANAYAEQEIFTFVVGVGVGEQPSLPAQPDSPAVDTYSALNELGLAGGAPWDGGTQARKFYDAAQPDELLLALDTGGDTVTDCTVDLTSSPGGPLDPLQIPYLVIETNGQEVPYVLDCENENGWAWIVDGEILTFCGSYCEGFKNGEMTFDIIYGCPDSTTS